MSEHEAFLELKTRLAIYLFLQTERNVEAALHECRLPDADRERQLKIISEDRHA